VLEPGDRVDGRFEVEARVGAGGMAEVFRVRHLSLGGVYALKILSRSRRRSATRTWWR
jgi:serine/threonine protein kinase